MNEQNILKSIEDITNKTNYSQIVWYKSRPNEFITTDGYTNKCILILLDESKLGGDIELTVHYVNSQLGKFSSKNIKYTVILNELAINVRKYSKTRKTELKKVDAESVLVYFVE